MYWTEDDYNEYLKRSGKQKTTQPPKRQKYNSKRTVVDGISFHSAKEAKYYSNLKLLQRAGAIRGFCRQPEFVLVEGSDRDRAITYSADFIIFHIDGSAEVIDVKGMETEQWKRTFKQFRLKFPNLELKIVSEV